MIVSYEERIAGVRKLRVEANKLRLACISAAGTGALLHVVYDAKIDLQTPADHFALLNAMK